MCGTTFVVAMCVGRVPVYWGGCRCLVRHWRVEVYFTGNGEDVDAWCIADLCRACSGVLRRSCRCAGVSKCISRVLGRM